MSVDVGSSQQSSEYSFPQSWLKLPRESVGTMQSPVLERGRNSNRRESKLTVSPLQLRKNNLLKQMPQHLMPVQRTATQKHNLILVSKSSRPIPIPLRRVCSSPTTPVSGSPEVSRVRSR